MIKAEKYDVCQYILPVRMICLFITFLFLVFGVYAQCCNAVQFGGATASLAGFLLIVISYFHSRFTSIRGLQYEANPLNSHEVYTLSLHDALPISIHTKSFIPKAF